MDPRKNYQSEVDWDKIINDYNQGYQSFINRKGVDLVISTLNPRITHPRSLRRIVIFGQHWVVRQYMTIQFVPSRSKEFKQAIRVKLYNVLFNYWHNSTIIQPRGVVALIAKWCVESLLEEMVFYYIIVRKIETRDINGWHSYDIISKHLKVYQWNDERNRMPVLRGSEGRHFGFSPSGFCDCYGGCPSEEEEERGRPFVVKLRKWGRK